MSREGAPSNKPKPVRAAGTPIWVWVIYGFGILAGAIVVFSGLFTLGALLLSGNVPVSLHVSTPAVVLWGVLLVAAVVTFIVRRRQR